MLNPSKTLNSNRMLVTVALILGTLTAAVAGAEAPTAGGAIRGTVIAPIPKHRAGAIVYVKQGPSMAPVAPKTVHLDQKGLVFLPRILPIARGWTVEFLNSDPVAHNVYTLDGEKYDLGTWPQGQNRKYTFTKAGTYRQLCRVHDDMIAFIVVLDTPWFAVSDKEGHFALSGLAPGSYTLGVWHEKLASPDLTVTVTGSAPTSTTTTLTLKAK